MRTAKAEGEVYMPANPAWWDMHSLMAKFTAEKMRHQGKRDEALSALRGRIHCREVARSLRRRSGSERRWPSP